MCISSMSPCTSASAFRTRQATCDSIYMVCHCWENFPSIRRRALSQAALLSSCIITRFQADASLLVLARPATNQTILATREDNPTWERNSRTHHARVTREEGIGLVLILQFRKAQRSDYLRFRKADTEEQQSLTHSLVLRIATCQQKDLRRYFVVEGAHNIAMRPLRVGKQWMLAHAKKLSFPAAEVVLADAPDPDLVCRGYRAEDVPVRPHAFEGFNALLIRDDGK
mmetsp:Transcript_33741/g.51038  ORF Transcript_33741/g.51038 Transcript_33741/m.51038 type:complete len:227 (-) Transcript_33741:238-918(-)